MPATQRTLSIIKPDATRRNLTGKINARFEDSGLRIIAQKRLHMTQDQAEKFYAVHKERPFFKDLVGFMISGPVIVQVLEGADAVALNRKIMGATNPKEALAGTLRRMTWVPGSLYSVNPATARALPGLFARNERVVCHFDTAHGPFVLVLVGATVVGSMATTWHGVVNPPRHPTVKSWDYESGLHRFEQGQEMGRFLLGSTVVMLWPKGPLAFNPDWAPARSIRLGEAMADLA